MKAELALRIGAITLALGIIGALESKESDCTGDTKFLNNDTVAVCEQNGVYMAYTQDGKTLQLRELVNLNRAYWNVKKNKLAYYQLRPYFVDIYNVDMMDGTETVESFYVPNSFDPHT